MVGKRALISRRGHRTVDQAVRDAEAKTGLQFCVYLGPTSEDTRAHAESMFVQAGLHERPAVLLLVGPDQRRIEIVTAPDVRTRIPDEETSAVIAEITGYFARGDFVEGLVVGIAELAARAGPGRDGPGEDLPNILE